MQKSLRHGGKARSQAGRKSQVSGISGREEKPGFRGLRPVGLKPPHLWYKLQAGAKMMIFSEQIELESDGSFNVICITDKVKEILENTGIINGQAMVFYQHTTGGIVIGEFEAGIVADWRDMFERIAPLNYDYKHHMRGVDLNGHAHCRAAILPVQATIPVVNGKLVTGTYQDILVIDDQRSADPRYVIVQIWGEPK